MCAPLARSSCRRMALPFFLSAAGLLGSRSQRTTAPPGDAATRAGIIGLALTLRLEPAPEPTEMPMNDKTATYQTYRGLPALAGLANMAAAAKAGLSVESCVGRLKRFHYAFKRLHEILNARITAEPIYELKTGFSHHAYLCAEHVMALRTRVGEMREPPLGLEEVPHPALEAGLDELLNAPTTKELLAGLYAHALPALDVALAQHLSDTHPVADAPSIRLIRFARLELADMLE